MDDVLSSIRRIIGSDKRDDDDAFESGADKYYVPPVGEEPPLELGPSLDRESSGEPMPLTPGMRAAEPGQGGLGDGPGRHGGAADQVPTPARPDAPVPSDSADDQGGDAVVIDEAALEDMIRRIVRDEVAAALPGDDRMREVVHEELQGDVGQNISENVQRLIRAEVARILNRQG